MRDYTAKSVAFYDKHPDEYMQKTKGMQDIKLIERFCEEIPPGGKVLDIGCGFGRDCKYFASHGFQTYGIDLSKELLSRARTLVPKAEFSVMDALNMEFEDASFDGVWCSALLVHIRHADAHQLMQEAARVSKPNALLYLHFKLGAEEGIVRDERYNGAEKFFAYYTEDFVRELLKEHYKVLAFEQVAPHGYQVSTNASILARKH
jgi:ubiquinone/menaquinone biosynthesis C-methylase UbiE